MTQHESKNVEISRRITPSVQSQGSGHVIDGSQYLNVIEEQKHAEKRPNDDAQEKRVRQARISERKDVVLPQKRPDFDQ